ncbi:glycoside hydrolase family 2 protein [Dyella ginsengisoli]|uniref:Beta-mannosidase B n=1 Tax=Dyella ginsengisoli TaxID=363848 RepID=A0ABW8JQB4_9GAMM
MSSLIPRYRPLHRPGWLLAGLLAGFVAANASASQSQPLERGWQLRMLPGSRAARDHPPFERWQAATVPGSVQADLVAHGQLPDPDWRDNEAKLQWVGLADWQYRLRFAVDPALRRERHLALVFDGLDTLADVTLDGRPVLHADNMFRRWRVPLDGLAGADEHTLTVTFHSPIAQWQPWLAQQPYALPGEFDSAFGDEPPGRQVTNYVRKAAYQFGWDWGPRLVTQGIWQDVRLEAWSGWRLDDFHVAQTHVDADRAQLRAGFAIQSDTAGPARLVVHWRAPDGREGTTARDVRLVAGAQQFDVPVAIARPQRWWPAGYGAPNLYRVSADVMVDGRVVAQAQRTVGLRSIELQRTPDRWGHSFAFVVNGAPVFAKGANLVPFDALPSRTTTARMRRLLDDARSVHMNMLRVWGGGTYLPDAFYAIADRRGLMIWQDFMFGGAIPPPDAAFRANVKQEAIEQVTRLRDHPSIVLWSGNNEVQTSWESWGDRQDFRKRIGPAESARIEQGMHALFDDTLREVATQLDPEVPYWPGSPESEGDAPANSPDSGDAHVWDVWGGSAPVEDYLKTTPRFQSEFGLQSLPVMATIRRFAAPQDLAIDSPVMRAHQKFDHGNGNQRLLLYVRRGYGEPKDFAAFAYLSQVMQADGIELAVDHLRSARPRSMGALYWQLNDVWPGASWSSIDVHGRWKALQFRARQFYAPVRVVPLRRDGRTSVFLVSDRATPLAAQLRTRVIGMDGTVVSDTTRAVTLPPLASVHVDNLADAALLRGADPHRTLAVFELIADGRTISRHLLYFDRAAALTLPAPDIRATLRRNANGLALDLVATRFARAVWIDFGDRDATLSDNGIDLLPGEHAVLQVRSQDDIDTLRRAMHIRSLVDAVAATPGTPP